MSWEAVLILYRNKGLKRRLKPAGGSRSGLKKEGAYAAEAPVFSQEPQGHLIYS